MKISILDLSSPPQSSESDDNRIMNYVSTASREAIKLPAAQNKQNALNNKVKCNQKIYHFLDKYANLNKRNYF